MENPNGKVLYRLNCSLLERLSEVGFPVSRLSRQRRMRPSIADLLRLVMPWLSVLSLRLSQDKQLPGARGQRNCTRVSSRQRDEEGRILPTPHKPGEFWS